MRITESSNRGVTQDKIHSASTYELRAECDKMCDGLVRIYSYTGSYFLDFQYECYW